MCISDLLLFSGTGRPPCSSRTSVFSFGLQVSRWCVHDCMLFRFSSTFTCSKNVFSTKGSAEKVSKIVWITGLRVRTEVCFGQGSICLMSLLSSFIINPFYIVLMESATRISHQTVQHTLYNSLVIQYF